MARRFALTVVLPGIILLGFGLRALQQDRSLTDQEARDRLERAADFTARAIDQQLANWQQLRSVGITLETEPVLKIVPAQSLAYDISKAPIPTETENMEPLLAEAQQREQVQGNIQAAISIYKRAATSSKPRVRAVAFARLGASYSKIGMRMAAVEAYQELLKYSKERIASRNADLIARFELASLGEADRRAFYSDLVKGRWRLDRSRYLFYSETARTWVSDSDPLLAEEQTKLRLSAAVERFLEAPQRFLGDHVAFWEPSRVLIIPVETLRTKLEHVVSVDQGVRIQLVKDRQLNAAASFRALGDPALPWVVEASLSDPKGVYAAADQRSAVYATILLFVFGLLILGSYVTVRTAKRELEVARLKNDFVATVSHEFRSPLTAIRQLSELLQRGRVLTEEKRQEYYSLISRESGRLARLVENLLDVSRIEDGRKQYQFDRFETADWLREVVSRFEKANIALFLPPELPPILGDRVALTSAVDNLIDNALKYSPPEAPVVCEAEVVKGELTIRVRDHGYGIAPEDRPHVFEKFYRGTGEASRRIEGVGVGLCLVRQIIEAHGGSIDFESCTGEGTVFNVRLKAV